MRRREGGKEGSKEEERKEEGRERVGERRKGGPASLVSEAEVVLNLCLSVSLLSMLTSCSCAQRSRATVGGDFSMVLYLDLCFSTGYRRYPGPSACLDPSMCIHYSLTRAWDRSPKDSYIVCSSQKERCVRFRGRNCWLNRIKAK